MNKKQLIIVAVITGAAIIGGIIYFVNKAKKKKQGGGEEAQSGDSTTAQSSTPNMGSTGIGSTVQSGSQGLSGTFAAAYQSAGASGGKIKATDNIGIVKQGQKGIYVVKLQAILNKRNNAGLKADGVYGSGTVAAVKKYVPFYTGNGTFVLGANIDNMFNSLDDGKKASVSGEFKNAQKYYEYQMGGSIRKS